MDSDQGSSSPPRAVSSLRNRFEQMAGLGVAGGHRPRASVAVTLDSPRDELPQRRVVSASSSSSNLAMQEALARRAPPPPPTTGRPTPTPPIISTAPPAEDQMGAVPPVGGVSGLRSLFSEQRPVSPAPTPSTSRILPRPTTPSLRPPSPSNFSTRSASPQPHGLAPPPIPLRLTKSADAPQPPPRKAAAPPSPPPRPQHTQFPSSQRGSSSSPSPPPLPSRKAPPDSDRDSAQDGDIWSRSSSETSASSTTLDMPPACAAPPPVPPRPGELRPPGRHPPQTTQSAPPPLPSRRVPPPSPIDSQMPPPPPTAFRRPPPPSPIQAPPLPSRLGSAHSTVPPRATTPTPRSNGLHIPPPPTRTLQLGAPLPARRASPLEPSSSDEEDYEATVEDKTAPITSALRRRTLDDLPDTSTASRRPPTLPGRPFPVHVPAHHGVGVVAMCGDIVLVAGAHVKIYDLSNLGFADEGYAAAAVNVLDTKDLGCEWRTKEHRVTAAEFVQDGIVWLGTRDGHLLVLSVDNAGATRVLDVRNAVHSGAVQHVLRAQGEVITVDENGKAMRWHHTEPGKVLRQTPRILRLPERCGYVGAHAGWLWAAASASVSTPQTGSTASLLGNHLSGTSTPTSGAPSIRVYDLRAPAATAHSIPLHEAGAAMCGTMLASDPGRVFLGHEGGVITIWSVEERGVDSPASLTPGRTPPTCVASLKVATGDVLSLIGAGSRLWAGGRAGMVAAFEVDARPWKAACIWKAHGELPVQRLAVDVFGIQKCGRLAVYSVGRDECVRFWDGLMGQEWISEQLAQREQSFCSYRPLRVLVCTWNVDAAKPEALTGSVENVTFFERLLREGAGTDAPPDVIAFGFQELIDLEDRKLTAKSVVFGSKKIKPDGSLSAKVSKQYRAWHDALVRAVRVAFPPEQPYVPVLTDNLVGLFTCIFVRAGEAHALRDAAVGTVKRGLGGRYGNKGAIVARFVVDDTSLCFVNCHLAAGQKHVKMRNQDVAAVLEDRGALAPASDVGEHEVAYVGGGDGSMVLDHEICFLNGDLNYRVDQRRDVVLTSIRAGDLQFLLQHDQLRKELARNPHFRLRGFVEPTIGFAPTYKYDRRASTYDSSEKRRVPAWCDRVLVRSRLPERVRAIEGGYRRWEPDVSDHRPVSAAFEVTVKKVARERREKARKDASMVWRATAADLLQRAMLWYADQGLFW